MLLAGGVVFVGEHGEAASAVISAELVACTLGARVRPELQMDAHARLREAFARVGDQFKGAARQIQKAFANHPASKLLSN